MENNNTTQQAAAPELNTGAGTLGELFNNVDLTNPGEEGGEQQQEQSTQQQAAAGEEQQGEQQQGEQQQTAQQETPGVAKFTIPKPPQAQAGEQQQGNQQQQQAAAAPTVEDFLRTATPEQRTNLLKALGFDDFDIEFSQFRKTGRDPLQYIEAKARDWNKVSDVDVIRQKIRSENSYMAPEDVEILEEMELKRYGLNDDASEAEKRAGGVLLKKDAHFARQHQIAEQAKFQIPQVQQQQQQQGPTAAEQWSQTVNDHPATKSLLQNKKVVANGGEPGYEFTFEIDDPTELIRAQTDTETFQKYAFDDTGKPKIENENLIALMRINPQFVVKSLIDHGREIEKKSKLTTNQRLDKNNTVIPPGNGQKSLGATMVTEGKDMSLGQLLR